MVAKHTYVDYIIKFCCLPVSYRTPVALSRMITDYFRTKTLLTSHRSFQFCRCVSSFIIILFWGGGVFGAFNLHIYDQTLIYFSHREPHVGSWRGYDGIRNLFHGF